MYKWTKLIRNTIADTIDVNYSYRDFDDKVLYGTYSIKKILSKYFPKYIKKLRLYNIASMHGELNVDIFIVNRENQFPLIEFNIIKEENNYIINKLINDNKIKLYTKISPNQIKDLIDLKFYLLWLINTIKLINQQYEIELKHLMCRQKIYDISYDTEILNYDVIKSNLIKNGYVINEENEEKYNQKPFGLKLYHYKLGLLKNRTLIYFKFLYTEEFKIDFSITVLNENNIYCYIDDDYIKPRNIELVTRWKQMKIKILNTSFNDEAIKEMETIVDDIMESKKYE